MRLIILLVLLVGCDINNNNDPRVFRDYRFSEMRQSGKMYRVGIGDDVKYDIIDVGVRREDDEYFINIYDVGMVYGVYGDTVFIADDSGLVDDPEKYILRLAYLYRGEK